MSRSSQCPKKTLDDIKKALVNEPDKLGTDCYTGAVIYESLAGWTSPSAPAYQNQMTNLVWGVYDQFTLQEVEKKKKFIKQMIWKGKDLGMKDGTFVGRFILSEFGKSMRKPQVETFLDIVKELFNELKEETQEEFAQKLFRFLSGFYWLTYQLVVKEPFQDMIKQFFRETFWGAVTEDQYTALESRMENRLAEKPSKDNWFFDTDN